jgi:hypothetical protein|tara:strand:+ start:8773 stop:8943 length:171 start_codon:yes stop_codon:yes gene_type:complete
MITKEGASKVGLTLREACAVAWCAKAMGDLIDHPKAVAMGADELAKWLTAPTEGED